MLLRSAEALGQRNVSADQPPPAHQPFDRFRVADVVWQPVRNFPHNQPGGVIDRADLGADARRGRVEPGSKLFTDAWRGYSGLSAEYEHEFVDHTVEYVRGAVHTNGVENFWSLLKRTIKGTYVSVEPFHLFRYLDEQAFRFNAREDDDYGRFRDVLSSIFGKRLTYTQLTGNEPDPTPA